MASDPAASFFSGSSTDSFFDSLSASSTFFSSAQIPVQNGNPLTASSQDPLTIANHAANNTTNFSLPSGWDTKISNDEDFFSSLSAKAGSPMIASGHESSGDSAVLSATAPDLLANPLRDETNFSSLPPAPSLVKPPTLLPTTTALTPAFSQPPSSSKPAPRLPPPLPAGPYPPSAGPPPLPSGPYPRNVPVRPPPPPVKSASASATPSPDNGRSPIASGTVTPSAAPNDRNAEVRSAANSASASPVSSSSFLSKPHVESALCAPVVKEVHVPSTRAAAPTLPESDSAKSPLDFSLSGTTEDSAFFDSLNSRPLTNVSLDDRESITAPEAADRAEPNPATPAPHQGTMSGPLVPQDIPKSTSQPPDGPSNRLQPPISWAPASPSELPGISSLNDSLSPAGLISLTPGPSAQMFSPNPFAGGVSSHLASFVTATQSTPVLTPSAVPLAITLPAATSFQPSSSAPPAVPLSTFTPNPSSQPSWAPPVQLAASAHVAPLVQLAPPQPKDFSNWAPTFIPAPAAGLIAPPVAIEAPSVKSSTPPASLPLTATPNSYWAQPPQLPPPPGSTATFISTFNPVGPSESSASPSGLRSALPTASPVFSTFDNPYQPRSVAQLSGSNVEPTARPHTVTAFGFGGKLALIFPARSEAQTFIPSSTKSPPQDPSATAIRVVSMRSVLEGHRSVQALVRFPGPLQASTSKDAVTKFIAERGSDLQSDPSAAVGPRLEAKRLLWELLRISVQHYGNISRRQAMSDENGDCLKSVQDLLIPKDTSVFVGGSFEHADAVSLNQPTPPSDSQVLSRIQHAVLSGSVRDAWKSALDARQWAHALVLARQLDDVAFQTTVSQLALSTFPDGSPLRALYLLFANSPDLFKALPQDAAPRASAYSLLDRWQENLAVLLTARKGDAASPAIGRLGDVLWARFGCVEAAHFCYLLADHALQEVDNPNSRLVLLGADHKIRRRSFISAEAIQRSEILEYSRKLGNSQYSAPTLHPYKLAYAAMLADFGLIDIAAKYIQQVLPTTRGKGAQIYHPLFIYYLNAFADRMAHSAAGISSSLSKTGKWKVIGSLGSGLGSLMSRGLNVLIGSGAEEDDLPPATSISSPFGSTAAPPAAGTSAGPGTFFPATSDPRSQQPQKTKASKQAEPVAPAKEKPKQAEPQTGSEQRSGAGWGGWLGWGKKAKNPVHLGKKLDYSQLQQEKASVEAPPPSDSQLGVAAALIPPGLAPIPRPLDSAALSASASAPGAPPGPAPAPPSFSRFGAARAGQRRYLDTFQPNQVFNGPAAATSLPSAVPSALPTPANLAQFAPPPAPPLVAPFAAFIPPASEPADTGFQLPDFLAPPTGPEPTSIAEPEASANSATTPVANAGGAWPSEPTPASNNDWLNDG